MRTLPILLLSLVACGDDSSMEVDAGDSAVQDGWSVDTGSLEDSGPADTGMVVDVGIADAPVDAAPEPPWPPPELLADPPPQPTGDGWRTAQWNVCTTRMDGGRLECRARIAPGDESRTAAQIERAAIAKDFLEDPNMYSFTLQEICEQDARWVAAFVANEGPPRGGFREDFDEAQYAALDERAPYAFLPYVTRELSEGRDYGCGPGISTGVAAIAKRLPETTGLLLRGLTNATYAERASTGVTNAHLRTAEVCANYFEAQTSYGPEDASGQYPAVRDFRSGGCVSEVPDTLRGLACVRTRWRGPGDAEDRTYRVTTCATHAVHRGASTWTVRNQHIDEAARQAFGFAGGTDQRMILSGDFNVVASRGGGASLSSQELGHTNILERHGLGKVSLGDHDASTRTGTIRGTDPDTTCGREIDGIYAKNAWWFHSPSPNATPCTIYGDADPPSEPPELNPYVWSDHIMMVGPLMSPHGSGPADL